MYVRSMSNAVYIAMAVSYLGGVEEVSEAELPQSV